MVVWEEGRMRKSDYHPVSFRPPRGHAQVDPLALPLRQPVDQRLSPSIATGRWISLGMNVVRS